MAISPVRSGQGQGSMKQMGDAVAANTENSRKARLEPDRKVEQQRVQGRSRRAQENEATERAMERRAEEKRGRNVDVQA